ncbi:MAG TPA: alanine racemase [Thermodesulfovibrionia bacterium]|nr:alanine racemase [Thermodesulfovibrionia bacterium]
MKLDALSHNLNVIRMKTMGRADCIAVVKANAYGHGAAAVAKHLEGQSVRWFGVAFLNEAIELRACGINASILVFFEPDPCVDLFFKHNLTPVIHDIRAALAFSEAAYRYNRVIPVHLNVDTGMGRVGFQHSTTAAAQILQIGEFRNLHLQGIMTHLANADLADKAFTHHQLQKFTGTIAALKEKGLVFDCIHMANSAAVLDFPDAHFNMVRPGIMLYGYGPAEDRSELKPVLTLKSQIIFLKSVPPQTPISYGSTFKTSRNSVIATVALGYADGYNRLLSNRGEVLIRGRRASVAGRVCMDLFMVDVTDIEGVCPGDEVVMLGVQGSEQITASNVAEQTGTISYEVLTSVSSALKRVYI